MLEQVPVTSDTDLVTSLKEQENLKESLVTEVGILRMRVYNHFKEGVAKLREEVSFLILKL